MPWLAIQAVQAIYGLRNARFCFTTGLALAKRVTDEANVFIFRQELLAYFSSSGRGTELFDYWLPSQMKTTTTLFLSLAVLAGCISPHKAEPPLLSSGYFPLKEGTNTVLLWCTLASGSQTDIQYVLWLTATNGLNGCLESFADPRHRGQHVNITRDGHQWLIEASGKLSSGIESLRLSDVTAQSAVNADLQRSRFWQLSEEGTLIQVDAVDPAVTNKVVQESKDFNEKTLAQHKAWHMP
jgi:hypothetical protein